MQNEHRVKMAHLSLGSARLACVKEASSPLTKWGISMEPRPLHCSWDLCCSDSVFSSARSLSPRPFSASRASAVYTCRAPHSPSLVVTNSAQAVSMLNIGWNSTLV